MSAADSLLITNGCDPTMDSRLKVVSPSRVVAWFVRASFSSVFGLIVVVPLLLVMLGIEGCRQVFAPLDGIQGWSYTHLRFRPNGHSILLYATQGVPLPPSTHNIWAADGQFGPDSKSFLRFSTNRPELEKFVQSFLGRPLMELPETPADANVAGHIDAEFQSMEQGVPWPVNEIKNGRYSKRLRSNGAVAIDLDTNTVYVKW